MVRRSGRLKKKPRINYSEDSLWERATGMAIDTWNKLVDIVEDPGATPPVMKRPPRPPPIQKLYKKKKLFRKKLPGAAEPKKSQKKLIIKKTKFEVDTEEADYKEEFPDQQPGDRVKLIMGKQKKQKKPKSVTFTIPISKKRKHMLFLNPGDESIYLAGMAIVNFAVLPPWAKFFQPNLIVKNQVLHWREPGAKDLPFAGVQEKRDLVKNMYFDPREPATILPIIVKLRKTHANITKKDVTRILRSFETYQRNFSRRRPPDIKNRMFLYSPGMIAMDMFFPSRKDGWEKYNCLCCLDSWSRYVGLYAIETKKYKDVLEGMKDFLKKFAALGHMPRRILSDKGSDMAAATKAIEPYRQQKDGDKLMVLHTATGTPVLIVEGMNAQVQRRMAVFRTSGLIESPAQILHEIAVQINNEPRQARGGLTPLQLLSLDQAGRDEINKKYRERYVPIAELHGLPNIKVNDQVRLLKMTRKEQETNKMKGFTAKWSKQIYTVFKKTKLRKNAFMFRYHIGLPDSYYRHELLKIHGGIVDTEVPQNLVRYKEVSIGSEYNPEDEEWDH